METFLLRCYKSHLKKQFGDKYKDPNPEKLAHNIHNLLPKAYQSKE